MRRKITYLLIVIAIILYSCGRKINEIPQANQIVVGSGPEDIILDTVSTTYPRILLACDINRNSNKPQGVFWEINLENNASKKITTLHKNVAPLGLKLIKKDDEYYLICSAYTNRKRHDKIVEYKIEMDSIIQVKTWSDRKKLIGLANNLYPYKNGIFVSNFVPKHYRFKLWLFPQFFMKKGAVLYLDSPEKDPKMVLSRLKQPNSFCIYDSYLYMTITGFDAIYRVRVLDGQLQENTFEQLKLSTKINKGDNITLNGDTLITAGFTGGGLPFLGKYITKRRAASYIYEIKVGENPKLLRKILIEEKDNMGLVSVAVKYKSKYYVGQIHNGKILNFDENDLIRIDANDNINFKLK